MRSSCFHQLFLPPFFARISSRTAPMLARWRWHCATRSRRILIVVVAYPGWPNPRLKVPPSSPASGSRRSGDWRINVGRGQALFSRVPSYLDHGARGCTVKLIVRRVTFVSSVSSRRYWMESLVYVVGHGCTTWTQSDPSWHSSGR
jgi:hypothetical protein